jgi:putative nucleotidyltransferase with HDIG domain
MTDKVQSYTKAAFIIALLWTTLIAFLTLNLVFSAKNDAYDNAVFEAKLSADNISTIIQWLTSVEDGYEALKGLVQPSQNSTETNNAVDKASNKQTIKNLIFTPIIHADKTIKIFFTTNKIVNNNPFHNSEQKLDRWEQQAYQELNGAEKEVLAQETINNQAYIRFIKPILSGENCLLCEKLKTNKNSNLLGGISVSIAIQPYYAKANHHIWQMSSYFLVVWLLGTAAIILAFIKAKRDITKKLKNYEENIYNLVDIIEKRDSYTAGHTRRVAKYALLIAQQMGLSKTQRSILYRAAMLHDIGKVSTPDSVLLKPGKLTTGEYDIIKNHVVSSYEILSNVSSYKDIAEVVRYHHEYYDGSGYPQGLKGDQIPFLSQILTIADDFDAMTTDRIYKDRKSIKDALNELEKLAGQQFNPTIVPFALKALTQIKVNDNISQLPGSNLEHERFSYFYKDNITQVYNHQYLELFLSKKETELKNYRYALLITMHNFTQYNKENSWGTGDKKLASIALALQHIDNHIIVFRLFGDDFVVLYKNEQQLNSKLKPLEKIIKNTCLQFSYQQIDLHNGEINSVEDIEAFI